jgi:hypothetical protein
MRGEDRIGTGIYKNKKKLSISNLPNLILTLLICAACWYLGYNSWIGFPVKSGSGDTYLWNVICGFLTEKKYTYLTGFTLLFLAAALLQRFNFRFVIFQGKTMLPFLLFLFLNSVNPDFFPIRPISIVLFLMIFALFELYGSYQNPSVVGRMFNMMFYLCVGSLVWPYILWFIPVFWIGMYQFRILDVRTFSATLLGLFTVFWFVLGWSVLKHDMTIFINIIQCLSDIHIVFARESWLAKLPILFVFCLFMIVMPVYVSLRESESSIRTSHFLSFLLIFGVFSFFLSFIYESAFVDIECVFYLSASIIASYSFSGKHGIVSFFLYYFIMAVLIILLFVRLWNYL